MTLYNNAYSFGAQLSAWGTASQSSLSTSHGHTVILGSSGALRKAPLKVLVLHSGAAEDCASCASRA
ncbi:hypothetical protein CesoFtcFv8_014402 [Champsocephalus esox]|uniref:Uncharacterized protein n=1 Tax=Champsocephalus esox TaxID=159716 RepID=A0AAN8BSF3_9TELE|nr:hypothetical protein CesoFtcFv8_014402 [Champsocephalus esox]